RRHRRQRQDRAGEECNQRARHAAMSPQPQEHGTVSARLCFSGVAGQPTLAGRSWRRAAPDPCGSAGHGLLQVCKVARSSLLGSIAVSPFSPEGGADRLGFGPAWKRSEAGRRRQHKGCQVSKKLLVVLQAASAAVILAAGSTPAFARTGSWDSIAVDDQRGSTGSEAGYGVCTANTSSGAQREAMQACRDAGNDDCKIV